MNNPNTHPVPAMVYGGAPSFDDPATPNPFTVIADLRAGLDVAKRLREHLPADAPELRQADDTIAAIEAAVAAYRAAPSEFDEAPSTTTDLAERMAMADELATLRADNDARGELIEQLRAERDELKTHMTLIRQAIDSTPFNDEWRMPWDAITQLDATRRVLAGERDYAHGQLSQIQVAVGWHNIEGLEPLAAVKALVERFGKVSEARDAAEFANRQAIATAAELDTVRSERDAARSELDTMRNAVAVANARADRQAARAERAEADLARQKRVTALMAQVAREMTQGDE